MIRTPTIRTWAMIAILAAAPGVAASAEPAQSCAARLKAADDARALAEVKLQEEMERADAQVYLTRLELSVTKQRLAAALAKCGAACAPAPAKAP